MSRLRILPSLLLLAWCVAVGQQTPAPPAPAAKPPDAAVYEQLYSRADFQNDGTGVIETTARLRLNSQSGLKDYGLLRFAYPRSNSTLDVLYVRVRKADGSVIETPLDTAQDVEAEISRVAPTYSDLRERHVAVRGLAAGDTIEYASRITTTKPLVPGQFWLAFEPTREVVTLDEQLTVTAPADRALLVRNGDTAPTIRREGGRQIYLWKWQNPTVKKKEKADIEDVQRQALGEFPPYEVQVTSFRSWEEMGKWFAALDSDRDVASPEIKARVEQLTRGLTSDDKKIAAIYDYVATQYRYIAVSFGIGRYQPHTAAEVFSYGYGDCKDKHTLLATMLKAAGIEAYPALVSAYRTIDEKLPSPQQFDHMITYVPRPGGALWLDSTTEVAPAGSLLPLLRGKPALVIRPGAIALERTPTSLPARVHESFEGSATLASDGKLHATVAWERSGDKGIQLRSVFRAIPQDRWDEVVQQLSYLSGFAGKITEPSLSAIEEIETPLKYTYSYDREGYGGWENGQTSPFMPHITMPELPDPEKEPTAKKVDVYLGPASEFVMHSKIAMPAGSDVFIPQPKVDLVEPFAEYHATYSYKGWVLEATRVLTLKQYMVPASQYDTLRAFIKGIDDDQDHMLTLHASSHPLDTVFTKVEAAQREVDKGVEACRQRDVPTGVTALNKAIELDPKIKGAWSALAVCEVVLSTDKGLADWRKEIELNPEWLPAYKQLGSVLMMLKRYDEAAEVWRKLQAVAPDDTDAGANLGSALYEGKQYKEAVAVLRSTVEKSPKNGVFQRYYGRAALKAGDREVGLAALAKAVELEPTALTYNDSAWELAEDNIELDKALDWSRKAVSLWEQRTRTISIDNLQRADVVSVDPLANFWDTLGWIYYRQGKLAEAEQLLKPAWELSQSKDIGNHLAEVYEKDHRDERARFTRAAAERAATPETVKLPWFVKGKNWSAEVFLLFAPNGKGGAKPTGLHFLEREKATAEAATALMGADYDVSLPPGSDARIVRKGVLYCGKYVGCTVTLMVPRDVRDVQ